MVVINLAALVAPAFVPSYLAELRDMRDGDGGDGCHRFFLFDNFRRSSH